MKIETTINAQLVDACHIVPFSFSNDDTITNGICLSPNLHRAFDRGLLTITEDYIVRISPTVREANSPYGIMQFEGKRIELPNALQHYPSVQNLSWHRKEKFVM
jgi:putative restriction endonuclease